jgi:mono/diheme cytochrome c family protein
MGRIGRGIVLAALVAGFVAMDGWGPMVGYFAQADTAVPATNPLSGNEAAIAEGRSWFRAVCGNCHGPNADGMGDRGAGADLRVFNKGFRKFVETVKNGRDVPNRMAKMPPWGGVLSDQQIYQIGAYLETLAKDGANWKGPAN